MIDTHCHIHDDEFPNDGTVALREAREAGVSDVVCVGTDAKYSQQAVAFARANDGAWASVGLHPHDAQHIDDMVTVAKLAGAEKVVAIGECGLDYYYDNSPRDVQKSVLRQHFELAAEHNLPMIFHIRGSVEDSSDAYRDFWPIFEEFNTRGVVHSFSAHHKQLQQIVEHNLFVGVNGIATFMKPGPQLDAIASVPLEKLLLETDAPLLTPVPYRGKINEPKYITTILAFLAELRDDTNENIGNTTSVNAQNLFGIPAQAA